jgi:hypothetical protein
VFGLEGSILTSFFFYFIKMWGLRFGEKGKGNIWESYITVMLTYKHKIQPKGLNFLLLYIFPTISRSSTFFAAKRFTFS